MSGFFQGLKTIKANPRFAGLVEKYHDAMGYRKIGLRFDDLIPEETPVVQEALRRLPPREYYDRLFRFRRALNLSANQTELDPQDWTKPEQDIPYLKPLIAGVESEVATKEAFDLMTEIPAPLLKHDEDGAEDGWIGGGDKGVKEEKAELIYSLPNDDEEIDRLHLQHYMQRWAFGGNFRAPVTAILSQAGCKVLDLGCGSGIWAMEIATDFPITIVTGVDIAPIQASTIKPANLDFITHNILRPFPFADASYDYVHMRSLFLAIPDRQWPSVVAEIVRVLKPGGYVELVEPEMNENGPQLGEAFAEWYKYFYDMTSAKGVGNVGPSLKHYLLSTNAIDDIEEQVRVLPACASPDPTLDRLAVLFRQDYLSATAALKPAILARGKISEIEYDKLVADAHEDMKTGPTGLSVFRVFGRKRRQ
ncbi:hypothetical protein HK104_005282 [Borealophlyctis nickersoniae]|nr:hypothetical protein HK104_005282 [Borealophlyctis nickersoniae]